MKGHINKRSTDSWSLIIELGRDANGKRKQKWLTVKGTKRDAQRELRKQLAALDNGTFIEPHKKTLSDFLTEWLNIIQTSIAHTTYVRYKDLCEKHIIPNIGHYLLLKLSPLTIEQYYQKALTEGRLDGTGGLSDRTVLHLHRVLKEALGYAVKWRMLANNPCDAVDTPKAEKRERSILKPDEIPTLLEASKPNWLLHIAHVLALGCGLRRGEVIALVWDAVDLNTGTLTIRQSAVQRQGRFYIKKPKSSSGIRKIAMPHAAIDVLKAHKVVQAKERLFFGKGYSEEGWLLARPDGSIWKPDSLTFAHRELIAGLGVTQITFHDLRHSHAAFLIAQNTHMKIISERLGHSSIGITMDTYGHLLPESDRTAADSINGMFDIKKNGN